MSSKLALLKFSLIFFTICIMATANLFSDSTAQASDRVSAQHRHDRACHKHWHKHHRDSAHRHKHCHHHKHEKQKRGHGDDHDRGRRRNHDDDYDYDMRDDHSRNENGNGGIIVPRPPVIHPPRPPVIKPPKLPTPWGIAKKIGKTVRFTKGDRRQIKKYYRKLSRRLQAMAPPSPPPGIDNLARRGAILPPALKIPGLRSKLKRKLSALPSGHKYGHLGRMVIIYDKRTRIIKDVKRAF